VRRHRYGTYVVAAYVVFLAHAAVDWDWELPAITATGLVLAAVAIAAGRSDRLPPARNRPAALAATVTAAVLVAWGLAASTTFSSAVSAAEAGRWQTSRELALRSAWWAPWSAEPWFLVGETDLALHDPHAARSAFARAAARDGRDWRTWYEVARTSTGAERARAVSLIAEENPLAVRRRR
jgi:hypothetical protein